MHTGNWPGVTVTTAQGTFEVHGQEYLLVDLPGTYSLSVHSEDEQIARDFICSGIASMILVVCDATCLERGLHLLKQILSLDDIKAHGTPVILCVNLYDEAVKKGITIDFSLLHDVLQIPVISSCARSQCDITEIKNAIHDTKDESYQYDCLDFSPKQLALETVTYTKANYRRREELLDRLITGRFTGSLIMVLLLVGIFWLSMTGANYPSQALWGILFWFEDKLAAAMTSIHAPEWMISAFVYGVYRVLAWVVSVMLPPMAIFFPLFTLLEDLGYLPRVAFNMDHAFQKCRACGKQCLTMAMGLGCNAAGVVGCRIIDSPRERLVAILTNAFVPCNGRLPTLFTLITLFFVAGISNSAVSSLASALFLTSSILLGILATLGASWLLTHTLLKGIPSSFTLELPPYRRPQIGRVIVRSIFDRTLFVLGRAAAVAAPAGLIIWILANISWTGPSGGWFVFTASTTAPSLLTSFTQFLDPLGRLMGMDGVILGAFILGFPANEIVLPIILMTYLQTGILTEMTGTHVLSELLLSHGWTWVTALCMLIFCLFHWPCSTTCLTIKKETGSLKWTVTAMLLPTLIGTILCITISAICHLLFF
ncbi:ferrous iron transporter B [Clostridium sp. AM58-1XD]|uniref:ferrous iron transporter B n=1 Tax=Clostridium sp. AM58-1XD TaxID=2292307 RepID=UPI000E4C8165|nr:ferrous iron transporter B [Clostridium sp. AM58-1XD]RGZ00183.1 ferrous iron transporter B [Clostridium sp. AM58-1XD]